MLITLVYFWYNFNKLEIINMTRRIYLVSLSHGSFLDKVFYIELLVKFIK